MDAVALTYAQALALHELLRAGKPLEEYLRELQPVQAGMFGIEMAARAKETEVDLHAAIRAITPRPAGTDEAHMLHALRLARAAILCHRFVPPVAPSPEKDAEALKAIDAILGAIATARGESFEPYKPREGSRG